MDKEVVLFPVILKDIQLSVEIKLEYLTDLT